MDYVNSCQYQSLTGIQEEPFIDDNQDIIDGNQDPDKWLKKSLPEDNHKFYGWNAFVPLSGELKKELKGFQPTNIYGTTGSQQDIPTNKDVKYVASYKDNVSLYNEVNNKKEHFTMCSKFNKSCPH